ncbi:hypothetical protein [Bradyrhizobium sp. USDA 4451]
MNRNDVFGLDLGTTHGVSHKKLDGGLDAQALRFEGNIDRRTVGVHGIIRGFAAADCVGSGIEESGAGGRAGVKAHFG